MKSNNSTKGFTLTIVRLPGGKKVLVGGNHTGQSALSAKMIHIEVVYIDEDLSMEEMLALGAARGNFNILSKFLTTLCLGILTATVFFPAIAMVPKAAIIATLYSAFPALLVAYCYYWLFE